MSIVRRPKVFQHPASAGCRDILLAQVVLDRDRQTGEATNWLTGLASAIDAIRLIQRAVGIDTNAFSVGLCSAMRLRLVSVSCRAVSDPDVN